MNIYTILFGLAIILSAFVLRHKYRILSEEARTIFGITVLLGVVTMFSVQSFSAPVLVALSVVEMVLSLALLLIFRTQLKRDRRARREAAQRAARRKMRLRVRENRAQVMETFLAAC